MNKKAIIFLGSIAGLIVIIVVVIIVIASRNSSSTATQTSTTTPTTTTTTTTTTPTTTPAPVQPTPITITPTTKLLRMTDSVAVGPVLSYDGTLLWYFTADGHLFKIDLKTGAKQEFILPTNLKVNNVIWPQTGSDFIVETDNATGKTFNYYSSKLNTFTAYPANVKEVDFMPSGQQVVYAWLDDASGKATLSIANFDLTAHVKIANLPDSDDVIKVAPTRARAFYYKAASPADGKIYYVNLTNKSIFSIKTAATNLVDWAPDSNHFLYNRLGPDGDAASTQLWLGDLDAKTDTALGINGTPAQAAFDRTGATLVVAQTNQNSEDFLVSSLQTAKKQTVSTGTGVLVNAAHMFVSNDGATLYFLNSSDGFVYSLPIQ